MCSSDLDEDGLAGNFIAFAISDTGVGMEAETLQHAFEPFFTTKSEGRRASASAWLPASSSNRAVPFVSTAKSGVAPR